MRRRAILAAAVLLAAFLSAPGLSLAAAAQKAPGESKVDVTYYYLPG